MTIAPEEKKAPVPDGYVRLTIDGREVDAPPKGEILIRTCERLGIIVPRFCDHPPLLDPAGAAASAWSRWRWAAVPCRSRRPAAR